MDKVRIYDLAREFKMESKELIRNLQDIGVEARNHMSLVNIEDINLLREKLGANLNSVEETRVASRVIRRRRKASEPEEGEENGEDISSAIALESYATNEQESAGHDSEQITNTVAKKLQPETVDVQKTEYNLPDNNLQPPVYNKIPPDVVAPGSTTSPQSDRELTNFNRPDKQHGNKLSGEKKIERRGGKSKSQYDTPARIISRPLPPVTHTPAVPDVNSDKPKPSRSVWRPESSTPGRTLPQTAPNLHHPSQTTDNTPVERDSSGRNYNKKKGKKGVGFSDDNLNANRINGKRKEIFDRHDLYDSDGRVPKIRRTIKKLKKTEVTIPKAIKRRIKVGEVISAFELAKRLGVKSAELIGKFLHMGMMVTANQTLDVDEASLIAAEFGFEVEKIGFEEEIFLEQMPDAPEDLIIRPPVVTIMGHVDHGKTSLLDAIRRTHVTEGEAGGITQHIGAYDVTLTRGGHVVFVDTPGHAAFTQMRARGAQVTDVVVLVVAADDGVMQQTKEAINHSRAAGVPIVVAINKIDKPAADPAKVKRELMDHGLVGEEWGGDTIIIEVSAKTGKGLDDLLEMLLLQSEVLELKANPDKPARGRILEARLDKGRGPVATVLVQEGTLKTNDFFVSGIYSGKVRAMLNDLGQPLESAGPSIPVEVQGLTGVAEAGDEFAVVENEKMARQIAEHRSFKKREAELSSKIRLSLEGFFEQMKEGAVQALNLVIKADVQGSVEAIIEALQRLGNEQVKINIIHAAPGAITETDIMLASASNAVLIGFNVRPNNKAAETARTEKVDIRTYDIIYQIIDDITAALTGLLAPIQYETVIGRAEVRNIFNVPKQGAIAGCGITSGKVERNALVRLLREGVIIASTKVDSLRRFKEDVKEVVQGFECGISLENFNDIKIGDEFEFYLIKEKAAEL
ncbi:MAG: translation initiation factor IF-2 [Desulfarculales bacterium]|jgi:translation initiation factor IF-2|nr:translation initiation factor IF-2 [Desulfarculales bacterium]